MSPAAADPASRTSTMSTPRSLSSPVSTTPICVPSTMAVSDRIEYRRFSPADADLLAEFLTTEDWPYHGSGTPDAVQIRKQAAAGHYDNDQTRAFWIVTASSAVAGLVRLLDLGDDTP